MKFLTAEGKELKALADAYAKANADLAIAKLAKSGRANIRRHQDNMQTAKRELHRAIESLTNIDITPRDVQEKSPA